jgi:hypothetical protein
MWVPDPSLNTISFSTLYKHHIKSTLGKTYYPYKAYFNKEIAYDLIEMEINNLIKAYHNSTHYKPLIDLYHNNKKLSDEIPILLRLNAIAYAIKYIPKAYYKFIIEPIRYIKPMHTTFKNDTYIKLFCILLVLITGFILHYNKKKYIYYCLVLFVILILLWKL